MKLENDLETLQMTFSGSLRLSGNSVFSYTAKLKTATQLFKTNILFRNIQREI